MSRRALSVRRWVGAVALVTVSILAASCTPDAAAIASDVVGQFPAATTAERIQQAVVAPITDSRAAATASRDPEPADVPIMPTATIARMLDRSTVAVEAARAAADQLAGMRVRAAATPRGKARKAAKQVEKMAQALQTLRDEAAPVDKVTDVLAMLRSAMRDSRAAAKQARKAARKIAKRVAQCPETARACIDLTTSMTWLQSRGEITYGPVRITSGRDGLRTRPGMWTVYWKHQNHVSGYYGTPMPNAIFFDRVGIAFHQGSLSELSHGCVHLSWEASQIYWDALDNGDKVYVFGHAPYRSGQAFL